MHLPDQFAEYDQQVLIEFIRKQPFASLVHNAGDFLDACQVPLLMFTEGERVVLQGHVSRRNPIFRVNTNSVLAIFSGQNHYISPGWYPHKSSDPKVVPTWNYQLVKAHGTIRCIDDPVWKRHNIEQLTDTHESGFENPWKVSDAPQDFINRLLAAIVGIEIQVTKLEGIFKLSQNQADKTQRAVAAELQKLGSPLAREMCRK